MVLDQRQQALQVWLEQYFSQTVQLSAASADASFRRYFRTVIAGRCYVVMDAPPPEDCASFVAVLARLSEAQINVPVLYAQDLERGFLLLSDLGEKTVLQTLQGEPQPPEIDTLMRAAIAALLDMQQRASVQGLPDYDEALLRRELELFPEWYLERHLGVELTDKQRARITDFFDDLIARLLTQATVFVHRDFMLRNLMMPNQWSAAESLSLGIIDFQDAVCGPISYDISSLLRDAFISWPVEKQQQWLEDYWRQARARQLAVPATLAQFQLDCDLMAVQRHLKVIGIFARIWQGEIDTFIASRNLSKACWED